MFWAWMALAGAADEMEEDPLFDLGASSFVCVSSRKKKQAKGALAIQRSPLVWADGQRQSVRDHRSEVPSSVLSQRWLESTARPEGPGLPGLLASMHPIDGTDHAILGVELAAWERGPVVLPNFIIIVDVSQSMSSVFTRRLPVLQNGVGTEGNRLTYPPVTRLELVQDALRDLLDRVPGQSRFSVVGIDGVHARRVFGPEFAEDREFIDAGLERLQRGLVRGFDRPMQRVLGKLSKQTFSDCHDNKVILFTDRIDGEFQRTAMQKVGRWASNDVEIWSFGVGVHGDIGFALAELEEAVGGGAWSVNARSDAASIWSGMLDPGGQVHERVQIDIEMPDGVQWREHQYGPWMSGDYRRSVSGMMSRDHWSRMLTLRPASALEVLTVRATVGERTLERRVDTRTAWTDAPDWIRTRAALAWWTEGSPDLVNPDDFGSTGQGAEIGAWHAHRQADEAERARREAIRAQP